jgi:hypothetical protein
LSANHIRWFNNFYFFKSPTYNSSNCSFAASLWPTSSNSSEASFPIHPHVNRAAQNIPPFQTYQPIPQEYLRLQDAAIMLLSKGPKPRRREERYLILELSHIVHLTVDGHVDFVARSELCDLFRGERFWHDGKGRLNV